MGSDIIVRGRPVAIGRDVRGWHESKLEFRARSQRTETRAVVLHWTGGENGAPGVFDTLRTKSPPLSVQFFVDHEGLIWQFCDANALCAQCGGANGWTVGIEIANRSRPVVNKRWPREVFTDHVHGRDRPTTRFYAAQIEAALDLTAFLCRAFGLPLEVPCDDEGKLVTTALSPEALSEYRGVLGHYHVTTKKDDPGTEILRELAKRAGKAV